MLRPYPLLLLLGIGLMTSCKKDNDTIEPEPPVVITPVEIKDTIVASGLSHPWEILWGPDNFIWMTERNGRISRVNPSSGAVNVITTIAEVEPYGEGGLLGMTLHPQFATNPYVYVVYNYDQSGSYKEKVVRYTFNSNSLTNPIVLLDNIAASYNHNGSRLLIHDNKLFITTGDAARTDLPQNNASPNGKILRINLDGSIPSDNPIANNPLWSLGHRNPQGLVMANNKLYSSEHGPDIDDELNIIEKSRNYGWPDVKGMCDGSELSFCNSNNVKEPLKAWTPTIAVCGLTYYNSNFIPQCKNSLLLTTLKDSKLLILKLDNSGTTITETTELLDDKYGRLRAVCVSPQGKVYVSSSNGSNDKLIEITKK